MNNPLIVIGAIVVVFISLYTGAFFYTFEKYDN